MSTPVAKTTRSTPECAAAHVLGCQFLEVSNIYTKAKPFRNSDLPGEVTYSVDARSSQYVKFDDGKAEPVTAEDVFTAFRDPIPAVEALNTVIHSIKDADTRRAAITALAPALAGCMAVFADGLKKISEQWRKVPPKRLIVRPGKREKTAEGWVDKTERMLVPLHPGPELRREWKI